MNLFIRKHSCNCTKKLYFNVNADGRLSVTLGNLIAGESNGILLDKPTSGAIATLDIDIDKNDTFAPAVDNPVKKTMKKPLKSSRQKLWLSSLGFFLCILGNSIQPSWAEGSKELVSDGGYRPYLEWSDLTAASIIRKTTLKVYVQAGETVNLGSSVHTSFSNPQDIVYRSPFGTQNGSCNVLDTGFGFINTVAKETAGPLPNAGGYTPCSFVATETGILVAIPLVVSSLQKLVFTKLNFVLRIQVVQAILRS